MRVSGVFTPNYLAVGDNLGTQGAKEMAAFTKRSNGHWQAKVRREGWPELSKTFRTKADARAWARAEERSMDVGAFINREDAERTTFKAAADRYSLEVLPKKRGKDQDAYLIKRLSEEFGNYSLASISPALLSEYRDKRLKAVGAQTVVHELGMVSRIFKAAALDWGIALPQGIPTTLVRKPKLPNGRDRRLKGDEEKLLLDALQRRETKWPHAAAVLAIETAARMSELLALTWSDVDLKRRVAVMRGKDGGVTKSGEATREVPLSKRAAALLKGLPRSIKGPVLPLTKNALHLAWLRATAQARQAHVHSLLRTSLAKKRFDAQAQDSEIRALIYKKRTPQPITLELLAKIEDEDTIMVGLNFHDLRHEGTSRLAEKLGMHELMKVTGHKTAKMLARYYHPRAEDLAKKLG